MLKTTTSPNPKLISWLRPTLFYRKLPNTVSLPSDGAVTFLLQARTMIARVRSERVSRTRGTSNPTFPGRRKKNEHANQTLSNSSPVHTPMLQYCCWQALQIVSNAPTTYSRSYGLGSFLRGRGEGGGGGGGILQRKKYNQERYMVLGK